jgi:hypothetical protein
VVVLALPAIVRLIWRMRQIYYASRAITTSSTPSNTTPFGIALVSPIAYISGVSIKRRLPSARAIRRYDCVSSVMARTMTI